MPGVARLHEGDAFALHRPGVDQAGLAWGSLRPPCGLQSVDERGKVMAVPIALGTVVIAYLIFDVILQCQLPRGTLWR
jgi:hypothetical protein